MQIIKQNNHYNELKVFFDNLPSNTKQTYITAINQFLEFVSKGINQIHTVSISELLRYIQFLRTKYKAATVNVKLASLKKLFVILELTYNIENIFKKISGLKIKPIKTEKVIKAQKVLSLDEIKIVLDFLYTKNSSTATRDYCLFRLLAETGLRVSEALSIKILDIKHFKTHFIITVIGKGQKQREVLISPELYSHLTTLSDNEFIFKSRSGTKLTRTYINRLFNDIGLKAFGRTITPHMLRHSFATHYISDHPAKLKGLSRYLGHSSVSTTLNMYIHNEVEYEDLKNNIFN